MSIAIDTIKKLRQQTGAGVMDAKRALEEVGGDLARAKEVLARMGFAKAKKRSVRTAAAGRIFSYIHGGGRVGVLLELNCETDFVARTDEFQQLGRELCLQVASMQPENVKDLLAQAYIRDAQKNVGELVREVVSKTGENVVVGRFVRYRLGERIEGGG